MDVFAGLLFRDQYIRVLLNIIKRNIQNVRDSILYNKRNFHFYLRKTCKLNIQTKQ